MLNDVFNAFYRVDGGKYYEQIYLAIMSEKTPSMAAVDAIEARMRDLIGREAYDEYDSAISVVECYCATKGYERGFVSGVRFMVECMTR